MGGPSEVRQLIIIDIAATRMIDIIWGVVNEMKFAHVTREPLHTAVRDILDVTALLDLEHSYCSFCIDTEEL